MADSEFEKLVKEFAKQQERTEAANAVDFQEMKDWWTKKVHDLFDQLDAWLCSLINSGSVKSLRTRTTLSELDLGSYEIESLELQLVSQKLTLKPVGTMLIGAHGRIDVTGPAGKVTLLLLDTQENTPCKERRNNVDWFIREPSASLQQNLINKPKPRQLTQDSFQQLFADLFGIMS